MPRNMRKNRCWFLWVLPLLLVWPDLSAWAAEGTAYLDFQKAVPSHDKEQIYIIRNGDTIARIVRKLGWATPRRYRVIRQLNPHIPDLNKIYPGQKLLLPPPGEPRGAASDDLEVSNYKAKKGDSLTRIIRSELQSEPTELAIILRSIKQLNPEVTNFNKIYPGQIIKIPRARRAGGDVDKLALPAPAPSAGDEKPLSLTLAVAEKYLPVIRHIIELLNGTVITSGNYFIPLPDSGQVTIDCTAIPVIELGDGTTVLLDFAGRLPGEVATVIHSHWKNYHLVKGISGKNMASLLQEIILFSPSFQMAKAAQPLSLDGIPQVKLTLDWLITKKSPSGGAFSQLGLIFAADKSQLLPSSSLVKYALKKGVNICEILGDKVQVRIPDATDLPPLPQIKGVANDDLLYNFLVYLGLEPLPDREVKIYDSQKDGFNLAVKAEYMMKMGGKSLLITKNKLPPQLSDKLKQEGMTSFSPVPGATKLSMLEGVLAALEIPYQFALFSLPPPPEKTRINVSFSALKIDGEKGPSYLIDYDLDREIYEFLTVQRKLNLMRY